MSSACPIPLPGWSTTILHYHFCDVLGPPKTSFFKTFDDQSITFASEGVLLKKEGPHEFSFQFLPIWNSQSLEIYSCMANEEHGKMFSQTTPRLGESTVLHTWTVETPEGVQYGLCAFGPQARGSTATLRNGTASRDSFFHRATAGWR